MFCKLFYTLFFLFLHHLKGWETSVTDKENAFYLGNSEETITFLETFGTSVSFVAERRPMMSHKNGWWLICGCSFRQFIAEHRIENGLQPEYFILKKKK